MVGLIVARSKNNVIGKNGQIPWRIKGEQKQFKELTTGNVVVMGRRSYEEIGHPLPNRDTIVVSRTKQFEGEHLRTAASVREAVEMAGDRDVYIAGGYGLYKEAVAFVDVMYITEVDTVVEDGDVFFPEFDEKAFNKTVGETGGDEITFTRTTYTRKKERTGMIETISMGEGTWRLEDGFVRFFLLAGTEKAVMIDSGMNCPNASELAKQLTDKPVMLLNTHGDGDHTSGTAGFSEIHIHPADYEGCEVGKRYPGTALAELHDGDVIDLGDRPLKIIHIPGHTAGSVAILDVKNRALYAGDSVQKGHIFMFGDKRRPNQFGASLEKLSAMKDEYDCIYASHDEFMVPADYAEKVKGAWEKVRAGEVPYEMIDRFGNKVRSYTTEVCGFFTE